VQVLLFELGQYSQFRGLANSCADSLAIVLPGIVIDYKNKNLTINDVTITTEI
jgi:hypothetical protein